MADEKINLEATPEKPRKINKVIVGTVAFSLVCATGFFMVSSFSSSKDKNTDNKVTTTTTNLSENELERMRKDNAAAANSSKQKQQGQLGTQSTNRSTATSSDTGSRSGSSADTSTYRNSTSNATSYSRSVAAAPPPTVVKEDPYEKFQAEKNQRSWAREEKEELEREAANKAAQQSSIFFTIKVADAPPQPDAKEQPSTVNDYYNSLGTDSYVTVVKGRQAR